MEILPVDLGSYWEELFHCGVWTGWVYIRVCKDECFEEQDSNEYSVFVNELHFLAFLPKLWGEEIENALRSLLIVLNRLLKPNSKVHTLIESLERSSRDPSWQELHIFKPFKFLFLQRFYQELLHFRNVLVGNKFLCILKQRCRFLFSVEAFDNPPHFLKQLKFPICAKEVILFFSNSVFSFKALYPSSLVTL